MRCEVAGNRTLNLSAEDGKRAANSQNLFVHLTERMHNRHIHNMNSNL